MVHPSDQQPTAGSYRAPQFRANPPLPGTTRHLKQQTLNPLEPNPGLPHHQKLLLVEDVCVAVESLLELEPPQLA